MRTFIISHRKIVFGLFWILIWGVAAGIIGYDLILPGPLTTLNSLMVLVVQKGFWESVFFSIFKIVSGFFLAVVVGILLASVSAVHKNIYDFFSIPFSVVKSVPVASYTILALFWMNSRHLCLFISFIMVLPLIYFSVYEGIQNTDRNLIQMAQVFQLKPAKKVTAIYLPEVLPYFESAAASAVGIAWKSGVAAELIALLNNSVGGRMYAAKVLMNMPEVFAWTIVIVILNWFMENIVSGLIKKVKKCQFI